MCTQTHTQTHTDTQTHRHTHTHTHAHERERVKQQSSYILLEICLIHIFTQHCGLSQGLGLHTCTCCYFPNQMRFAFSCRCCIPMVWASFTSWWAWLLQATSFQLSSSSSRSVSLPLILCLNKTFSTSFVQNSHLFKISKNVLIEL